MHRGNEGISSSSSLLSGGSSTVPQCLLEEYEDYLRRSYEDFLPLPRIFTKTIFTPEEPGALYKRYQLKANQTPIRMDKSDAWRSVAQDQELSAAKEAVKAMRNLQAIIQCKAQICFGQSTKDNHWSNKREDVRIQNKEARRILIELDESKQGNIARSAVYQELDLDDNWDIVSADFDDSNTPVEEVVFMAIKEDDESDDEQEEEDNQFSHHTFMFHPGPPTKIAKMGSCHRDLWKPKKENLQPKVKNVSMNGKKTRNYLGKTVNVKRKQPQKSEEEKDFSNNEVKLLKELLKEKTEQVQQMIRDQARVLENKDAMQKKEGQYGKRLEEQKDEEIRELKAQLQKKEEEAEAQFSREEFPPLGNTHVARPCIETEVHYSGNATASPKIRKITNQLYNVKVEFDIPNCTAFGTTAIIDTGASAMLHKQESHSKRSTGASNSYCRLQWLKFKTAGYS
ncbi:hypothetical protein Tco_1419995 [Tanacetum coccineum]